MLRRYLAPAARDRTHCNVCIRVPLSKNYISRLYVTDSPILPRGFKYPFAHPNLVTPELTQMWASFRQPLPNDDRPCGYYLYVPYLGGKSCVMPCACFAELAGTVPG